MVEVDDTAVFPEPATWRAGQFSNETAVALGSQMRGLETISMTRRNGRGPDSSLKRLSIFVYTWIKPYG